MYISLLDSSEIASSSPSLRLRAWFDGPGRGWRSSAETSGRTDKLTEGQPGGLDPASPALPAVPNSRAAPRAALRSAAPPPAPGSQWGAREEGRRAGGGGAAGAGRGYKRPSTGTPCCGRALGALGRRWPSARHSRLVDQAGTRRCCGCGVCAAGAAAPKRCTTSGLGCVRRRLIGQPRALFPLSFPGFPPPALHDPVLSGPPWKLGFRSLCRLPEARRCPRGRGRALGPHPVGTAVVYAPRVALAVSAGGAALPSRRGRGRQATPLSEKGRPFGGSSLWVGRELGMRVPWRDGRRGEVGLGDGGGASRLIPSVTWSPESREELERVRSVPRFLPGPALRFPGMQARACSKPSLAPGTGIARQFGFRQQLASEQLSLPPAF